MRIIPAQPLGVRGRDVQLGPLPPEPLLVVGEAVFTGAELHLHLGADIPPHRLGVTHLLPERGGLMDAKVSQRFDEGGLSHLVSTLDHGDPVEELQGAFCGAAVVA